MERSLEQKGLPEVSSTQHPSCAPGHASTREALSSRGDAGHPGARASLPRASRACALSRRAASGSDSTCHTRAVQRHAGGTFRQRFPSPLSCAHARQRAAGTPARAHLQGSRSALPSHGASRAAVCLNVAPTASSYCAQLIAPATAGSSDANTAHSARGTRVRRGRVAAAQTHSRCAADVERFPAPCAASPLLPLSAAHPPAPAARAPDTPRPVFMKRH